MTNKIYTVKAWIDDGWQRFDINHKVLASSEERAAKLVKQYWLAKDHTNIVKIKHVELEHNFIEGVIC